MLIEKFDNSISNEEDIIIDCNDETQVNIQYDVDLNSNITFSLPYIEKDLELDCNIDYNKENYNN